MKEHYVQIVCRESDMLPALEAKHMLHEALIRELGAGVEMEERPVLLTDRAIPNERENSYGGRFVIYSAIGRAS